MRLLPGMEAIWASGDYTGPRRPMARVTIQRPKMALRTFGLMANYSFIKVAASGVPSFEPGAFGIDPNHKRKITNVYADLLFTPPTPPMELKNVKSLQWNRSLDSDTASLTMTLYNTAPRDVTDAIPSPFPSSRKDLDRPGWYTYNRGRTPYSKRWGHVTNAWAGMVMPDNLIRTYEGYGWDPDVAPELDANLAPTGVWLIDSVEMTALGMITVNARDLGRLLLDQQANLPVVPQDFEPLAFEDWDDPIPTPPARQRVPLKIAGHSGRYGPFKISDGVYTDTSPFDPDNYRRHHPTDVLDDDPATFWMSFAHVRPNWRWATEWIEVELNPATIDQVGLWLVGSGYTMYVSVYADGHWVNPHGEPAGDGDPNVPWQYNPLSPPYPDYRDQHAVIPYHHTEITGTKYTRGLVMIDFGKPIPKVTKIRFSFRNLQHLPGIAPATHSYRVGIRQIRVDAAAAAGTRKLTPGPAGANPGRYSDYTDIIKLVCAWAGFYWPPSGYNLATDGTHIPVSFRRSDTVLGVYGRVWGDFETTGESGIVKIDALINRSLMDVVTTVREIIGYAFFIDEFGAVQWRLPNVYKLGNWISDRTSHAGRTTRIRVIDERQTITDLTTTLNSRNVFEVIRVSNLAGGADGVAACWNPNPIGLRRVGTWNEDRFKPGELQRTADMTAAAALWLYRTDRVTVPGFPGLQIDDQVRIFERVTTEGNIHYIKAIQSSHDLETGEWTYQLDTQWLGENPETTWAMLAQDLPKGVLTQLTKQPARRQYRTPGT